MRSAVILHGKPNRDSYDEPGFAPSRAHWFPWLKRELKARGIDAATPDVPNAYPGDALYVLVEQSAATTGRTLGYTCSQDVDSIPLMRTLQSTRWRTG